MVKAFALVTAVSAATRLMSFFFKIYLSRELGAEILGLYQIALSVLGLMSCVGSSGVPVTLSRLSAENDALGRRRDSDALTTLCMLSSGGAALALTLASLAFPSVVEKLFPDPRCVPVFYACLPMLMTTSVYATLRGRFWGERNYGVFAATELLDEIAKIVLSVLFITALGVTADAPVAYAYALVAGDVIVVAVLCVCYFASGAKASRPHGARKVLASAAPLTAARLTGSAIGTLNSLMLPALLVSLCGLTTAEATAEFGRASGMVMPLLFTPSSLTGSLAVVLIPELASMSASGSRDAVERTSAMAVKFAAAVSAFFFVIFCACGVPIGTLLYHDAVAGKYLSAASAAMIPMCVNGICASVLNSLGHEKATFAVGTVGALLLAALMAALVGSCGIYAYFIAILVSHTLSLGAYLFLMHRHAGLTVKTTLSVAALIAFGSLAALSLSQLAAALSALPTAAIVAAIGAAALLLCAAFVGATGIFTKRDIESLLKK